MWVEVWGAAIAEPGVNHYKMCAPVGARESHPKSKIPIVLPPFLSQENEMEEVGFEPTVPLLVLLFSKQMHSATLPLFREKIILPNFKIFW